MATVLRIGPGDHGRPMTYDEFMARDYKDGYRYELIGGRLYVSPMPNLPHEWIVQHVVDALKSYLQRNQEMLDWVTTGSRVFVPGPGATTAPEPDVAAYRDFPRHRRSTADWRDVSPVLVVEVLGGEDDEKDLVRNPDLYFRVPTIEEYWVYDIREDSVRPKLRVYRRAPEGWEIRDYDPDAVYRTPLLPGFEMPVTPPE